MSEDIPSYEEIEARLWAVESERDAYRAALEEIFDFAGPIDQSFGQDIQDMRDIADKALQRAGGGE